MDNTNLITLIANLFSEIWQRLFKKDSPVLFKVIQVISAVLGVISGIPALLAQFGIQLPPQDVFIENKAIWIAALVGLFISKLTVTDPIGLPLTAPVTPKA